MLFRGASFLIKMEKKNFMILFCFIYKLNSEDVTAILDDGTFYRPKRKFRLVVSIESLHIIFGLVKITNFVFWFFYFTILLRRALGSETSTSQICVSCLAFFQFLVG